MAEIEVIGVESTQSIIKKSAGGKPLYIKITNGHNTGANKDYPGYYEFVAASPNLSQIAGFESERNDKESGVALFISAVFRSRNIEPQSAAFPCIKGGGNKIVEWPNGTVVKTGTGCFDAPVLNLMAMTNIGETKFDGNVEVYGTVGKALTLHAVQKLLPKTVMGYMKFMTTKGHSEGISLDLESVFGDFVSDGISFSQFAPTGLSYKSSEAMARIMNCDSAPNLSNCKTTQNLVLYKCEYKQDKMPSEFAGNLAVYFCDLQGVEKFPKVKGNLSIVGCSGFDWGKVFPELEVDGDLIIGEQIASEKDFPDEKGIKELVKNCNEVKIQKESEIESIIGSSDPNDDSKEIGSASDKTSDYTKGILNVVNKEFGTIGVGVAKGVARLFGKKIDYDPNAKKGKNQDEEDLAAMKRVMSKMESKKPEEKKNENQATNQVNNQAIQQQQKNQ